MSHHRCPPWCHKCPDLIAIVADRGGDVDDPVEFTMPMCMGTASLGIGACHCHALDDRSVSTRAERLALLRELVTAYPAMARRLVAELAPPPETAKPRLRSVPSL